MKKFSLIIILFSIIVSAQQMNQQIDMKIDSLGNAQIQISMDMNAAQWDVWNNSFGANPAALKREIERSMPNFYLEDFQLNKDDMNRSFSLTVTALGICEVDKKGKWTLDTDQKDAKLTKISDHKYMLVSSPPEYGGQLHQQFTIEFPQEAKEIELEENAFGESTFEFKMDHSHSSNSSNQILRYAGIALLVFGTGWGGYNMTSKK